MATSAPATTRLIVSALCERFTVDGQIEAWTFGEPGRPVVFVQHGLGSRKERMLELALRLAEAGYRAVAVDAPAHGDRRNPESSARLADPENPDFVPFLMGIVQLAADDLARVAAALGETRWAVAGHSLGGRIALDAMHRHPGTVCVAAIGAPFGDQLLPDNLSPIWRERIDAAEPRSNPHHYAPRPVLLAHAADDPVTPASGSRAVADALREAYPLGSGLPAHVEIPTGGHDLVPELQEAVVGFMAVHFPAP